MRLWALATQNEALRDLASLQLTIMKRTTYEYFWMLDSNKNRPQSMIKNKVVGIFFEHKIDYVSTIRKKKGGACWGYDALYVFSLGFSRQPTLAGTWSSFMVSSSFL